MNSAASAMPSGPTFVPQRRNAHGDAASTFSFAVTQISQQLRVCGVKVTVPLAWRLMIWTGAAVKNIFLAGVAIITTLAAGPVRAADMRAAPLPPPVTAYNWTGWYGGVNGGAGFSRSQSVDVLETFNGASFFSGNFGTLKAHGPFGGGQIGYNWQTGPFVLGSRPTSKPRTSATLKASP